MPPRKFSLQFSLRLGYVVTVRVTMKDFAS